MRRSKQVGGSQSDDSARSLRLCSRETTYFPNRTARPSSFLFPPYCRTGKVQDCYNACIICLKSRTSLRIIHIKTEICVISSQNARIVSHLVNRVCVNWNIPRNSGLSNLHHTLALLAMLLRDRRVTAGQTWITRVELKLSSSPLPYFTLKHMLLWYRKVNGEV